MCVIAIKPKKIKIKKKTLFDMFDSNPDGAGLAVVLNNSTIISKGYFDPDHLWDDVATIQDHSLVLHFRLATHGQINEENCHPFVIHEDERESADVYKETELSVLVHNGIIPGYGTDKISDTWDFVTTCLARCNDTTDKLRLLHLIQSKFALIDSGKVYTTGEFYNYQGLTVSNTHFNNLYFENKHENRIPTRKIGDYGNDWEVECALFPEHAYSDKIKRKRV